MSNTAPVSPVSMASQMSTRFINSCSFVAQRLITKEDPIHLHKVLGIMALVSFYYRYAVVRGSANLLGFGDNLSLDYLTMAIHMALSGSAIIFHVLRNRLFSHPLIIYEEYRLHAIVFTLRGTLVYLFAVFVKPAVQQYALSLSDPWGAIVDNLLHLSLYFVVMFNHYLADHITTLYGTQGNTAVRVNNDPGRRGFIYVLGQRSYSFYQIMAVCSHLSNSEHLAAMGYNTHIAIQSSALLMTLYRKHVIPWQIHAGLYLLCLSVSIQQMIMAHQYVMFYVLTLAAFTLRTKYYVNKYLVWIMFTVITSPFVGKLLMENTWVLDAALAQYQAFTHLYKNMLMSLKFF